MLIDCDLRKPQVHAVFALNKKTGVAEYLSDCADVKEIVKNTKITNLSAITSGEVEYHPGETISSEKLPELFNELKRHYDMVIVDAPPFINLADSFILSEITDGIILVMRSGKTFISPVLRIKDFLEQKKDKILSIILNDVAKSSKYYDQYYYYYGDKKNARRGSHEVKKAE